MPIVNLILNKTKGGKKEVVRNIVILVFFLLYAADMIVHAIIGNNYVDPGV